MSLIYFAFTPCFFFLILLCKHYFLNIFQYSNHYFVLGSKAGRLLVQKHSSEQTNVTSLNNLQVQCSFYSLNAPKKKTSIDWFKEKERKLLKGLSLEIWRCLNFGSHSRGKEWAFLISCAVCVNKNILTTIKFVIKSSQL